MKISNSKKELARIISENGGWRDGAEWAAMDKTDGNCNDNSVGFFSGELRPECFGKIKMWRCRHIETVFMGYEKSIFAKKIIGNWHQSCLSRAEYFHLYPTPDAKPQFCESVVRSIQEPDEHVLTNQPTIEQLAADYRNLLDFAQRKQQEADDAKADAEAKLAELVAACEAIGLTVSPITAKQEPELVITDLLYLRVGDMIWIGDSGSIVNCPEGEYEIVEIDNEDQDQCVGVEWDGSICWPQLRKRNWKFISRP